MTDRQIRSQQYRRVSLTAQRKDFTNEELKSLNERFDSDDPDALLHWASDQFGKTLVLGTGFGPSGIVLIHRLVELGLSVKVFCLDTGVLFKQTYKLWKKVERRFDISIEKVSPILTLDGQRDLHKANLWESNPDRCCHIRKVLPLQKYLANKHAWITGLRRSQSERRGQTQPVHWDSENRVYKLSPLLNWSRERVWDYIHEHDLPYNPMHDDGFPSIGCIPCTAPADDQSDERSGRWKEMEKTECGIHLPTLDSKEDQQNSS
jgi:phosphoadenosine phosphosulfate reductase